MTEKAIKHYLQEKGIRQNYVAGRIGMDPKKFSAMMTGRRKVAVEELAQICQVLEKPMEYFVEGANNNDNSTENPR